MRPESVVEQKKRTIQRNGSDAGWDIDRGPKNRKIRVTTVDPVVVTREHGLPKSDSYWTSRIQQLFESCSVGSSWEEV